MRDGTQTRKRLERCALVLFVQKGVNATTIKDIAQQADIAEGTLYRHYQSKEELAQHLFREPYAVVSQEIKQLSLQYLTVEEKIKAMVYLFCKRYDEDPILFNYLLLAQHNQIKQLAGKESGAHDLLVPIFNEAIQKKEVGKQDPHLYSDILLGIVLQAAVSRVYERVSRTMMADADNLIKAVMGALKEVG